MTQHMLLDYVTKTHISPLPGKICSFVFNLGGRSAIQHFPTPLVGIQKKLRIK